MQTNTFQGIIITDNIQSYYIFSYSCGDIQWSGQGFETAIVGYNSNGDYYENHLANGLPDIGRIISCSRYRIRQPGRMKRQNDDMGRNLASIVTSNSSLNDIIRDCEDQYMVDDRDFRGTDYRAVGANQTLACPPMGVQCALDPQFKIFSPPYEPQENCYRSKPTYNGFHNYDEFDFVSVCCYRNNG